MEVLSGFFGLVGILLALGIVAIAALFVGGAILGVWPLIVGVGVGGFLWFQGFDNLGAIVGIAGLIGQPIWISYFMDKK